MSSASSTYWSHQEDEDDEDDAEEAALIGSDRIVLIIKQQIWIRNFLNTEKKKNKTFWRFLNIIYLNFCLDFI